MNVKPGDLAIVVRYIPGPYEHFAGMVVNVIEAAPTTEYAFPDGTLADAAKPGHWIVDFGRPVPTPLWRTGPVLNRRYGSCPDSALRRIDPLDEPDATPRAVDRPEVIAA